MNRILTYITYIFAGALLFVACDKNEPSKFDDANAFVAFGKSSVSINEATVKASGEIVDNTSTIKIPVSLASVKGLSATIKFEIIDTVNTFSATKNDEVFDKTAHSGVNFKNLTTSGTLAFDSQNRTQYIEIQPVYLNEYTGDLKFKINLFPSDNVVLGEASSCTVTISDVNHPLTAMLGDYSMTDKSYWDGIETYNISLEKDAEDDHMVWLRNFGNVSSRDDMMFYGNVDDDMTTINIPFGQGTTYLYSYGFPLYLDGLSTDFNLLESGSMNVTINKTDEGAVTGLSFDKDYGLWIVSWKEAAHENNVNFAIVLPGTLSAVKK